MENNSPLQTTQSVQQTQTPTPTQSPPSQSSSSQQLAKKEGSNKLLVVILAVLFLGFGLLGGYFMAQNSPIPLSAKPTTAPTVNPTAVPTIDPTADWKTYTSTNNVYSVKYPSDTFIRYICPNEELTLVVRKTETEETKTMPTCARGGRYDIEIVTLTQSFSEPQPSENYSVTKTATTVGGVPATKYVTRLIQQPANGDMAIPYSQDIYVTKNGKTYLLHVGSEALQPVFEDILSTFKFLN